MVTARFPGSSSHRRCTISCCRACAPRGDSSGSWTPRCRPRRANIVWDDGDPWQFRLDVEEDDQEQLWRLSGHVCRGGSVVPLSDVVLLMATGLVLFPDRLARLDVSPDHFGWIVILRAQPAIEVPYSDRDRLLEHSIACRSFRKSTCRRRYGFDSFEEKPRGRIEIKSPKTSRLSFTQ